MNKLFHTKPKKQFGVNADALKPSQPYVRTNFVNQQGVVAQAEFKPVGNDYTGIFQGADNVIIRLADYNLQLEDENGNPAKDSLNPSMAVKFLRDGQPSANFHGMVSFEQKGGSIFGNDFVNHIPDFTENEVCLPQTIGLFNARATPFIFQSGNLGLATIDQAGIEIDADKVKFPWQLKFSPVAANLPQLDENKRFFDTLPQAIVSGTHMFDVLALEKPSSTEWKIVG